MIINYICMGVGLMCFAAFAAIVYKSRDVGVNWASILAVIVLFVAGTMLIWAYSLIPRTCGPNDFSESANCVQRY